MKIRIEFPATDVVEEKPARVMQDNDAGFYLVTEDFFVWIDSTQELVDELLKFKND